MKKSDLDKLLGGYTVPRGMSVAKAKKRGMCVLAPKETNKLCGKSQFSIFIPYFDLTGHQIIYEGEKFGRLRLLAKKQFGKMVEPKPKFRQIKHTPNMFYLDKEFKKWKQLAENANQPIIFTEGEIKGAVAVEFGFPTIALGGVWSWRTKINGAAQPITDFDLWKWKKRVVYTCFDSDAISNPQVHHALMELSFELKRRGAFVFNVTLPSGDDESKLGLDDFLVKYGAKELQALIDEAEEISIEPAIKKMNKEYAYITIGGGGAVLRENDGVEHAPSFELFTTGSMREYFCNKTKIKLTDEKSIGIFDYWRSHPARREYKGIVFNPDHEVDDYYNLWKGFVCEPVKGKWDLYRKHIFENICNRDKEQYEYTLAWMADAIQNISDKPGVAYVMKGGKGTGKGVFATHFGALFGSHFGAFYQASHITGKFNAHLKDKLLVFADEAFFAGDKQGESALKGLITEETTPIEFKGKDTFIIRNMVRLMIAGNGDWLAPASGDERRFFCVNVSEEHQQDHKYFKAIEEQMNDGGYEALLYYLMHYNLDGVNLRDVPVTDALVEQKELTMSTFHKFWQEKLMDGWLENRKAMWGDGVVKCDSLYDQYLQYANSVHCKYPITKCSFGRKLKEILGGNHKRVQMMRSSKRDWFYKFPPLKVCREYFDNFLGMAADWE